MKKYILPILTVMMVCKLAVAQEMTGYSLYIDKVDQDAANIHVKCAFSLDFSGKDSVLMNFGGAPEFSVDNLSVAGEGCSYEYRPDRKSLVFYRNGAGTAGIMMEYDYTNLSAFFIYGEGKAELWETSFGEYFYPYIPDTYIDADISVRLPDSLSLLCSCPLESRHILAQSIVLAFIQKDAYSHTVEYIPEKVDIYQISGMQCNEKRYRELLELTQAAISYFSGIYGEDYISGIRNIHSFPAYLFHDGKGFSNRYNIGFISASQEKFSTSPDIYPLVHEIGHRWLGEWTLLIEDGEPSAYFIKESLNEFMTLMFIRDYYGEDRYGALIEKYKEEYSKINGTRQDEPIVDVVVNNNNTVIYRKGPLVLDRIARNLGYEKLTEIISKFYRQYAGCQPLKYTDFVELVCESDPETGKMLEFLLSVKSLP